MKGGVRDSRDSKGVKETEIQGGGRETKEIESRFFGIGRPEIGVNSDSSRSLNAYGYIGHGLLIVGYRIF